MRVIFPIPAELRANWIFQVTEGEHRKECLSGVRKAMVVLAVAPLFLLLFLVLPITLLAFFLRNDWRQAWWLRAALFTCWSHSS